MTELERRKRILEICEQNEDYMAWKAEYDRAQKKFTVFTDKLPVRLRNFLWSVPVTGYFLHHRMLNVICEVMRFPEELKSSSEEG